mgnify:CR=1 FL=1
MTLTYEMEQFLLPWFITNILSLVVVYVCNRWRQAGRYVFGAIFLMAAIVNAWLAIVRPAVYLDYGKFAFLTVYKSFIYGFFAQHTTFFVLLIALGQLAIAAGLFLNGQLLRPALAGAAIFLLAIVPLGVGSAFPATLFMVAGLYLIGRNRKING